MVTIFPEIIFVGFLFRIFYFFFRAAASVCSMHRRLATPDAMLHYARELECMAAYILFAFAIFFV